MKAYDILEGWMLAVKGFKWKNIYLLDSCGVASHVYSTCIFSQALTTDRILGSHHRHGFLGLIANVQPRKVFRYQAECKSTGLEPVFSFSDCKIMKWFAVVRNV